MSHPVFDAWWDKYNTDHPRGRQKDAAWAAWQLCYAHAAECAKKTAAKEALLEIETAVMHRIRILNADLENRRTEEA